MICKILIIFTAWIRENENFTLDLTPAASEAMQLITKNTCVVVTGDNESTLHYVSHYVATELHKEGYEIVPTECPLDILYDINNKQNRVFVFDNAFGTFENQIVKQWNDNLDQLKASLQKVKLGEDTSTTGERGNKVLMSSRLDVYKLPPVVEISTALGFVKCYIRAGRKSKYEDFVPPNKYQVIVDNV